MTYGFVMDVPAPIGLYDAIHAELERRTGGHIEGMLVHLGWATDRGFRIVEVWGSREQYDRFNREVMDPLIAELSGGRPPAGPAAMEEFEPRALVVATTRAGTPG